MAKKSSTRRITRRDAIALIGAGTVAGVARPEPAAAQPHPECSRAADVATFSGTINGKPSEAVVSWSCCQETRNAVLAGISEPTRAPSKQGRTHLMPLRDRLVTDTLDEYCVMIWGLERTQAETLYRQLPEQLKLRQRTPKK